MAKRLPNPNTVYGRKRIRKEHEQWKQSLPQKEREDVESFGFWGTLIVVGIIMFIVYLVSGPAGLLKWMRH
jgi:hypothetical protein